MILKIISIVLIILSCLLLLIALSKVTVTINLELANDINQLSVNISSLYGLLHKTWNYSLTNIVADQADYLHNYSEPAAKKLTDNETEMNLLARISQYKQALAKALHYVDLYKVATYFLKKVKVNEFRWLTIIGTGKANTTAIIVGQLWSLKAMFLGLVGNFCHVKHNPHFNIVPNFYGRQFQVSFKCIVQLKIGHAILTALKLLKEWQRINQKVKRKTEVQAPT